MNIKNGYEVHYTVSKKVFLTERQYKEINEDTLKKDISKHEGVNEENIKFVATERIINE